VFDLVEQDDGNPRPITFRQDAVTIDRYFTRFDVEFLPKMQRGRYDSTQNGSLHETE
jgi:hypothetical protein